MIPVINNINDKYYYIINDIDKYDCNCVKKRWQAKSYELRGCFLCVEESSLMKNVSLTVHCEDLSSQVAVINFQHFSANLSH